MSRPVDPDEPTRRLPADAPLPPPREYEREVVVADDYVWREEIIDRLNSLRTAVVLLGVVAVAALGVALWALLTQEEEGDVRRPASAAQVRDLEQRVDDLEQQLDNVPSRDAVSQISDNIKSLDERVAKVEDESGDSGAIQQAIEDAQGDVQQLSDSVQQLDERVQALEEQQTP